jgi:putative DNA primase/helicase
MDHSMNDTQPPMKSQAASLTAPATIIPFARPEVVVSGNGQLGPLDRCVSATSDLQADDLPTGYALLEDGIYVFGNDDEGEATSQRICSPMRIVAIAHRKDGTGWSKLLVFTDRDGNRHERIVLDAELSSGFGNVLRLLMDEGFRLERGKAVKDLFLALYHGWVPSQRIELVDQIGWTGLSYSAFVLGNGTIIGEGVYRLAPRLAIGNGAEQCSSGSLEDWTSEVAALCSGNTLMVLAVSLAFSGPLLQLLAMDGGGLHLLGELSQGKSSILAVGASVWGNPLKLQTWNATANGLEARAALCSDTLMILDELGRADGRIVGETIYMLVNGRGKGRMTSHAALRRDSSWCIPLLSSGEISVEQKMAEANRSMMAGQAIRLLHIVADNRTHGAFDVLYDTDVPAVFAERINTSAGACFGTAGPEFVKRLIAAIMTTDVRAMVKRMSASFSEKLSKNHDLTTDGQVARALKRFALIGVAGEIATQFGITGWSRGEAMRAAAEGFRLWIEERGHVRSHEVKDTIGRVRAYLREYGSDRFATQLVPIVA